jgi:hypothetical protein
MDDMPDDKASEAPEPEPTPEPAPLPPKPKPPSMSERMAEVERTLGIRRDEPTGEDA